MRIEYPRIPAATFAWALLLARPAFAQEAGWTDSFISILDSLTSGLGLLGTSLVGLGIMAYGAWGALTGRMDWNRIIYAVIGGVLVMAGPTAISELLGASEG